MRLEVRNKGVYCESSIDSLVGTQSPLVSTQSSVLGPQSMLLSPHHLLMRIADITYSIISVDPCLKLHIDEASQEFLIHEINPPWPIGHPRIPPCSPDVTIEARWDDLSVNVTNGKKIFDRGSTWKLYQQNGCYLFSFHSPLIGSIPYKELHIQKDFSRGEVTLHSPYFNSEQPIYPLEYPLDELIFIHFLSLGRGVEIHSCGVIDSSGNGYLFPGQSGAGKSTTARLWQDEPGITILNDDRIVLRKVDGKVWMYGTPWHGDAKLASPARAPLTAVYLLRHGQKNELIPQRRTEALSRLFSCSFLPFYNKEALDFTLAFFEEVVKVMPCYELRFLPNKEAVEFIQKES